MAEGITEIRFSPFLGSSPASTHRPSGVVWLNSSFKLPKAYWEFIIDHEEGHIKGDNKSEIKADEHASRKFFLNHPNQPWLTVDALEKVLPMNTEEQKLRVQLQKQRAAKFDCVNNGKCNSHYTGQAAEYSGFDWGCGPACKKAQGQAQQAKDDYQYALLQGANALTLKRLEMASQFATLEALKYSADADAQQKMLDIKQQQNSGLSMGQIAAIGLVAVAALIIGFLMIGE